MTEEFLELVRFLCLVYSLWQGAYLLFAYSTLIGRNEKVTISRPFFFLWAVSTAVVITL